MFRRDKAILHLHRRGIRLIEQEIGVTEMNLTEKEFVKFLSKFDEHPFDVKIGDEVSHIGKSPFICSAGISFYNGRRHGFF